MGILTDYLPDYKQLWDFHINARRGHIPPEDEWCIANESRFAIKKSLVVEGKIDVEGKLSVVNGG